MRNRILTICVTLFLIPGISCDKETKEYFRDPETEPVVQSILASTAIGYTASLAMSVMAGEQLPYVISTKNCPEYPCASLIYVDINPNNPFPFTGDTSGEIIIAGLWPDADGAILTAFFYDLDISSSTFTLKNIHTFPVAREEGKLIAVFAGMDINLGSNPIFPLELNLTEGEINFELSRLDFNKPGDVYVAVDQHAYIVEIEQGSTLGDLSDDSYIITGGGQIIEVTDDTGGIIQQALLNVEMNSLCFENPFGGLALIKNTKAGDNILPELGTALLSFRKPCDGMAEVTLATGIYIRSNGKMIPLELN